MYDYFNRWTGRDGVIRADVEWTFNVEEMVDPQQKDGHNCGVLAVSMLESCLMRRLNRFRQLKNLNRDDTEIALSTTRGIMMREMLRSVSTYRDSSIGNRSPVDWLTEGDVTMDDLAIEALRGGTELSLAKALAYTVPDEAEVLN